MDKWEYTTITIIDEDNFNIVLNNWGVRGWEAYHIKETEYEDYLEQIVYLKRKVVD